jgi:putative SOS response-associated peptidase YedK
MEQVADSFTVNKTAGSQAGTMARMCGRYTVRRVSLIFTAFDAVPEVGFEEFTERPSLFNIAPSQHAPIIRLNANGQRIVSAVRWGLIPHWTKGKPKQQPVNARSETAVSSPMFRQALERRRCLVPADGFYEWQGARPPKQPYFIHMQDDQMFAFAGVWERWKPDEDAEPVDTFTILTTEPNAIMSPIHNRMPVILAEKDYDRWLDRNGSADGVKDLLKPFDAGAMDAYPISTRVNKPANDDEQCIEPMDAE